MGSGRCLPDLPQPPAHLLFEGDYGDSKRFWRLLNEFRGQGLDAPLVEAQVIGVKYEQGHEEGSGSSARRRSRCISARKSSNVGSSRNRPA